MELCIPYSSRNNLLLLLCVSKNKYYVHYLQDAISSAVYNRII